MAKTSLARDVQDLHLEHLSKSFAGSVAVNDLSLTIPAGSFFALLGPSGCGKTTTLRMVAGLEEPTNGRIKLGTKDITETRPYERKINTVFQSYALFPHMDIYENVAFGLRRRKDVSDLDRRVHDMLALVELDELARRKPGQLSGGQQQRIALARAIINSPDVLLLDEPLGALDLKLRRQMQIELKRIQIETGITFVHVTHDQEEAMTMADTVAVMYAGRIEQMGPPTEIYERPRTAFVANFLGQSNLFEGEIVGRAENDCLAVKVGDSTLKIPADKSKNSSGRIVFGVRPEKMTTEDVDKRRGEYDNYIQGTVLDASFTGVSVQYLVETPWGQELNIFERNVDVRELGRLGEAVDVLWRSKNVFVLDPDSDINDGLEYLGEPVAE